MNDCMKSCRINQWISLFVFVAFISMNGRSVVGQTFEAPYKDRRSGLSAAWFNTLAAPDVFASLEGCRAQLEALKAIGIDCLFAGEDKTFSVVESGSSADPLENIYALADELGFQVISLIPVQASEWMTYSDEELAGLSSSVLSRAEEIVGRFGSRSGFGGFILPLSIDGKNFTGQEVCTRLGGFIGSLVTRLRELAPGKVIAGLGQMAVGDEAAATKNMWDDFLQTASLDVLVICEGLSEDRDLESTILEQHLGALVRAADENNVRLWGAIEMVQVDHENGDAAVSATYPNVNRQLSRIQKYTERLVALPSTEFLLPDTSSESNRTAAQLLYQRYQSWYDKNSASFSPLTPAVPPIAANPPSKTIGGSFAQIIGAAQYFADPEYIGAELDRMQAVGVEMIIPDSTFRDIAYYPSEYLTGRENDADALGAILNACAERDMEMLLSLPHFEYSWVWTFNSDTASFFEKVDPMIQEMHSLYGDHPAFGGWYIPYELCDAFLGDASHRSHVAGAFKHMADLCHQLTPGKPVMISPYFTTNLPDDRFAEIWGETIAQSGVDVVAMQDSVGALNVSGTETLRMQYLPHYIDLIADLCEQKGVTFWWNVETFAQTHGTPIDSQGWSATTADFERVQRQVAYAAERAVKIINFDFPHYFSPGYPNQTIANRNVLFYEAYKAWYESLPQ